MVSHIVKSRVVKVSVGGPTGNRVARVLFEGDVVPEGVSDEQLERLVGRGLIAVDETDDGTENAPAEVTVPPGEPAEKWTVAQLKKYAAEHGIDLGDAKNKGDVFAVITATAATPPAPAGD